LTVLEKLAAGYEILGRKFYQCIAQTTSNFSKNDQ